MDEQLEKILECVKEIEKQMHILETLPEKPVPFKDLIKHASDHLIPGMKAFVHKAKNIEKHNSLTAEADQQGLIELARYEAFSMFYEEKPRP